MAARDLRGQDLKGHDLKGHELNGRFGSSMWCRLLKCLTTEKE